MATLNPFARASSKAGSGLIHLALLPPHTPRLKAINYQYPLKLVSPAPSRTGDGYGRLVHIVYLLTYGGGIVAGDSIDLHVVIERLTRLVLLTQGTTKIFKSPSRGVVSSQKTRVDLHVGAALCYLPDPAQPFEHSAIATQQLYNIHYSSERQDQLGSLCVLDWVSNGRPANGENWSFYRYSSKNELRLVGDDGTERWLLRDSILLNDEGTDGDTRARVAGMGVLGTLILYGPQFETLSQFLVDEFKGLPRIGSRNWDNDSDDENSGTKQYARQQQAISDGLLWSVALVRGCCVVKFAATKVEGAKRWLSSVLSEEGTITREFGEKALLCLR